MCKSGLKLQCPSGHQRTAHTFSIICWRTFGHHYYKQENTHSLFFFNCSCSWIHLQIHLRLVFLIEQMLCSWTFGKHYFGKHRIIITWSSNCKEENKWMISITTSKNIFSAISNKTLNRFKSIFTLYCIKGQWHLLSVFIYILQLDAFLCCYYWNIHLISI